MHIFIRNECLFPPKDIKKFREASFVAPNWKTIQRSFTEGINGDIITHRTQVSAGVGTMIRKDDSHRHNADKENSDTKEFILHDSHCTKFQKQAKLLYGKKYQRLVPVGWRQY